MPRKSIVLYLHVHQPWRIRDDYNLFEVGSTKSCFREGVGLKRQSNGEIFRKVSQKSYLPMNKLLLKLLQTNPNFKLSLSITGTFIDQALEFAPDILDSFKVLVRTGQVEIVAETYYHGLAFFYDLPEFEAQVKMHRDKIRQIFGAETTSFRNTELAYNDELASWADRAGFKAILAEGWDKVLGWRSPNHVYKPPRTKNIKLLLKNYRLSDDLAFRFSDPNWSEFPLSVDKYIAWIDESSRDSEIVNLFMDYETFGEHQWAESGIFHFFEKFIQSWSNTPNHGFMTISEAAEKYPSVAEITIPQTITWADQERDLTAWLGNSMQREAMCDLYKMRQDIILCGDHKLIEDWRRLTTSDHPYYMCTKYFSDGDVHAYFSPYATPYDAFLYFCDALRDINYRLAKIKQNQIIPTKLFHKTKNLDQKIKSVKINRKSRKKLHKYSRKTNKQTRGLTILLDSLGVKNG